MRLLQFLNDRSRVSGVMFEHHDAGGAHPADGNLTDNALKGFALDPVRNPRIAEDVRQQVCLGRVTGPIDFDQSFIVDLLWSFFTHAGILPAGAWRTEGEVSFPFTARRSRMARMDNAQIVFAALYVALTAVFAYLAVLRASRGVPRIFWITFAVLTAIAGLPNFVPTTARNNIRIDLLLVDYILLPIFGILAAIAIWITLVRQLRNEKSEKPRGMIPPDPS